MSVASSREAPTASRSAERGPFAPSALTLSGVEIGSCARIPEPPVLDQLRSVYAAAFAEPPYEEPASAADDFLERLQRYATTRDGFRLVLAQRDDCSVIGFVLAALARPGDWWREQVAATLAPGDIQRRLGASCVEIVHVAVHPGQRSRGTGTTMMDAVRRQALAPRGILAVNPNARPALRLYERCGWKPISRTFRLGDAPPAWLMVRSLP